MKIYIVRHEQIPNNVFEPFEAKVKYIWIYNQNMELIN